MESLRTVPQHLVKLKTVWSFDCNPAEYKVFDGMPPIVHYFLGDSRWGGTLNKNDGNYASLAEIISTPVFHKNRMYVAIGRDAAMGRGRGALHCIDATRRAVRVRGGQKAEATRSHQRGIADLLYARSSQRHPVRRINCRVDGGGNEPTLSVPQLAATDGPPQCPKETGYP
jgi:hypothetical protein